MNRAERLNERRRRIEPPADRRTSQAVRPEVPRSGLYPVQCVIRSLKVASKTMTAQLVKGTGDPLEAGEATAGLEEHVVAFGKEFKVKPLLGTPYSFWDIKGLVVPKPKTPELEEAEVLGANFIVCKLYPGDYVEVSFKIPGAAFSDANAETSEGGGV